MWVRVRVNVRGEGSGSGSGSGSGWADHAGGRALMRLRRAARRGHEAGGAAGGEAGGLRAAQVVLATARPCHAAQVAATVLG